MQPVYVIIPAAGMGQRMGGASAKQYLPLNGRPMILHTLDVFLKHPDVSQLIVATHPQDKEWPRMAVNDPSVIRIDGGQERCHSVWNGLEYLKQQSLTADAWVMVHDAARPCVSSEEITKLIKCVDGHRLGGILGAPVVDTIKQVKQGEIVKTVDRSQLWRALTPQMFRFGVLYRALQKIVATNTLVSDEAMAVEFLDEGQPLMIEGSNRNIKVTYPEDIELAEKYLQALA